MQRLIANAPVTDRQMGGSPMAEKGCSRALPCTRVSRIFELTFGSQEAFWIVTAIEDADTEIDWYAMTFWRLVIPRAIS